MALRLLQVNGVISPSKQKLTLNTLDSSGKVVKINSFTLKNVCTLRSIQLASWFVRKVSSASESNNDGESTSKEDVLLTREGWGATAYLAVKGRALGPPSMVRIRIHMEPKTAFHTLKLSL